MGSGFFAGAVAAARIRRTGSGALQRAPRAIPAALRGRQSARGLSLDARSVLSHPQAPGAAVRASAIDSDAAEESAASARGSVEAQRPRFGKFPSRDR